MKKTVIISILILLIFACQRKTVASSEIVSSNQPNSEVKTEAPSSELIAQGKTVYINRCGRCHGLKKTTKYTAESWTKILKTMIPKSKINATEAEQVTAFVIEHSKK